MPTVGTSLSQLKCKSIDPPIIFDNTHNIFLWKYELSLQSKQTAMSAPSPNKHSEIIIEMYITCITTIYRKTGVGVELE